ncbi:hypothetical protein ACH4U6_16535 [Streptomyces netropsis]|uniref:hypothetical protein n=1 Tax=Streptomyces netropsis TaxID=55404 RepID=UPI003793C463
MAAALMLFLAKPMATAASDKPAEVSAADVDTKGRPGCERGHICFSWRDTPLLIRDAGMQVYQLAKPYRGKVEHVINASKEMYCLYAKAAFSGLVARVNPGEAGQLQAPYRTNSIRPC